MSIKTRHLAGVLVMAWAFFGASVAQGAMLTMIPFNATSSGLQIDVEVTTDGSNALFTITNSSTGSAAGSSVARIYFESGLSGVGLSVGSVVAQNGTDFDTSYPGPNSPPSGNNIPSNPWAGNMIALGAGSPPPVNGIGVGDSLTLSFNYAGSESSLISALIDFSGNARLAAHILDCNGGNSCVASAAQVVPLPAALPLLIAALGGMGVWGRKKA